MSQFRRIDAPDRPEFAREDSTTSDLRDAIDRLIGYLSRTAWHRNPHNFDFGHVDRLLDDIEVKRDADLDRRKAMKARRDERRGSS